MYLELYVYRNEFRLEATYILLRLKTFQPVGHLTKLLALPNDARRGEGSFRFRREFRIPKTRKDTRRRLPWPATSPFLKRKRGFLFQQFYFDLISNFFSSEVQNFKFPGFFTFPLLFDYEIIQTKHNFNVWYGLFPRHLILFVD